MKCTNRTSSVPLAPSSCALDEMQAVKLRSMPWHMSTMQRTRSGDFDSANAFNGLNRQVTLRNTQVICSALAPILINTCGNPSWLFVDGECMLSKEGTT